MRRVREERVSGPLAAAGRRAGVKGRGGGGAAPSAVPWSAGWGGVPTRGAEFFDSETRDPESSPSGGTEGHFSLRAAQCFLGTLAWTKSYDRSAGVAV